MARAPARFVALDPEVVRRRLVAVVERSVAKIKDAARKEGLRVIGEFLKSESQLAFRSQALGPIKWPQRYPNQPEPFVNFAGAVQWLNRGTKAATLPNRVFERRPALMSTGELMRSVSWRVTSNDSVEVGSPLPYAPLHQWGGKSVQEVSPGAKKKLARLMKRARKGRAPEAIKKLGFLFRADELETNVGARPFVGIPRDARYEKCLISRIEQTLQRAIDRGGT
jgi:phage gpG-like protein